MSLGTKKFVDSTSLTAFDINEYLMNQTVMVFASSAARTTAFSSAGVTITEGMVSYLLDTNATQYYDGTTWASYATAAGVVTSLTGTANQITVSASTGAVTASLPSAVSITGTMTAYTGTRTITLGTWAPDPNWGGVVSSNGYLLMGHNSDSNCYLRTSGVGNVNIGGNGNNTLIVGSGSASITGSFTVSNYIAAGGTGNTDTGAVSCNGWFRAYGNTGIYFQSWGGGWSMTDGTWIRSYGSKNVYTDAELRFGGLFSSNATRYRGSYGGMSFGPNGALNNWDGIEWQSPYSQTLMIGQIGAAGYSGMYYNNSTWSWLFNYGTMIIPSDVRYKREIQPLTIGLDFIKALEPISYLKLTECTDDDPEATQDGYYYGFSAQNVRAALDACGETRDVRIHDIGGPNMGLVACTEDAVYDRQFIGLTEFISPIVLAIQELSAQVESLQQLVKE